MPRDWQPSDSSDLTLMVKVKKPSILFLMETKMHNSKLEMIKHSLGFNCLFTVEGVGISGGTTLLWKRLCEA